jgi:hypothetical protein
MEGYSPDEDSFKESQGQEWSQNSQWMQEIAAPIFRTNPTLLSQILHPQLQHGPNLFSSSSSAFRPPSLVPPSTVGAEILQVKEEVATAAKGVGKKRGRPLKEKATPRGKAKKTPTKTDVIELGESDEEGVASVKWRDFEVHHLIAIRGEMDDEFARTANKQGIFSQIFFRRFKRMRANVGRMMRP